MTETKGYFGQFGGSFVLEPIQALLDELEATFEKYKDDPEFLKEYRHYLADYLGRETPLIAPPKGLNKMEVTSSDI